MIAALRRQLAAARPGRGAARAKARGTGGPGRLGALAALLMLAAAAGAPAASAVTSPDEMLRDPAQEARARALSRELRCLVCQNQSIDDSDADLARDLRRLVRERVAAGESDEEVRRHLVARYGEFVLLKPPVGPATWLLWFGPPAALLLGGAVLVASHRARPREAGTPDRLTPEERARLERLLAEGGAEAEGPPR